MSEPQDPDTFQVVVHKLISATNKAVKAPITLEAIVSLLRAQEEYFKHSYEKCQMGKES